MMLVAQMILGLHDSLQNISTESFFFRTGTFYSFCSTDDLPRGGSAERPFSLLLWSAGAQETSGSAAT